MTVSSETAKSGPYTGNGVTTVFAYGFRILDAGHIEVIRTVAGTASTVSPGDYTVSGIGDLAGGNVTFAVAPASGQTITIIRNAPFTQQTDLENQGAYYAETIEEALDLAAMRDQQMAEELTRAVKLPVGYDPSQLAALTEDLIRVADSADEIDTVAGIEADVTTVAGISGDVTTVAGIAADVTTVAGVAASVPAVAAVDTEVTTVAGIAANVTTVAGISGNVSTVAGISSDVTTVAGLTAEIAALPGQLSSAQAAAAAAEAALDSFDDRYLGAKAVAPTVDNDGNALLVGAVYWDTVSNQMFTWSGAEWRPTFLTGNAVRALVTATGGQTVVTVPTYLVGANTIQVYLNGLKVMVGADYTETDQNTITFLSALTAGDEVEVIVLQPYAIGTTDADLITTEYGVSLGRLLELREGTVADLLADMTLNPADVPVGSVIEAGGFRYEVAAAGATDHHVTTAGGVKLYVLPGDSGYSLKAFGAVLDGVTDDTVALQKAVDTAFSLTGGELYGGDGTCLISSAIVIPLYTGFTFRGGSRAGFKIEQATDNTPIFRLTKENVNNFTFKSMSLTWSNLQPIGNTSAAAFLFDGDTATGAGFYNFEISDIEWSRGCRGMSTSDTRSNLVWGWALDRVTHASTMSGSSVRILPASGGSPNIRIGQLYMRGDAAQEALVQLKACNSFSIENIEVNNDTNGVAIFEATAGSSGRIGAIRSESGVFTTTGRALVTASDSDLVIDTFVLSTTTFNAVGGKFYLVRASGGNSFIRVGTMNFGTITLTAGSLFALDGNASRRIIVDYIDPAVISQCTGLTDVDASAAAAGVSVNDWDRKKPSANIGDANATATMGGANILYFSTELTAARTVTLPRAFNPTNVYEGAEFTVVRDAATPGAFALNVVTSGVAGTLVSIPSGTRASVSVVYRRNAWRIVSYGVLP